MLAAEHQDVGRTSEASMGLEAVEFIIDLEKALGLSIPDRDVDWTTGRDVVAYLCRRMPEIDPAFGTSSARWTQAEIEYVVEGFLAKDGRRPDVSLDTDLRSVFP
jgi:hypothetical protein